MFFTNEKSSVIFYIRKKVRRRLLYGTCMMNLYELRLDFLVPKGGKPPKGRIYKIIILILFNKLNF